MNLLTMKLLATGLKIFDAPLICNKLTLLEKKHES